ncbi:LysR family transcriptional regulator [Tropicibacter sp. R15_0]|uniref:LysR substrate-binding domain-containing protein n=1 Tax=Tropicibacter sp. R15_0 TaxID=2821101 RepID=UPI001ADC45EC|nr:LysR substrate-binding domain-containing protein [Tropicibacter sp. R15_0]MBO9463654.1 LysR family transcriptional regulator [Tropicibacter sp. R15_0]
MSRRHYDLPPFTTLAAFEAAARHLSFKNAAQDLSVTPGAVSHQIKALEGELGTPLFRRQHRGVELTPEGEALYETLAASFGQISRQLARIRQVGGSETVTVGSTTAVAALWLSPTIIDFWREYPEINVNQVTQDTPFMSVQGFDFIISYGRLSNRPNTHTPIYRDDLVPVAAPELARQLASCSLENLAAQRLIHLKAQNPSWTQWEEWFQRLDFKGTLGHGTSVTSYSVALQIARKGAGVALGWRRLVQPMLDSGKLAIIEPFSVPAPHQFYLVGPPDAALSENAKTLKQWLMSGFDKVSI